MFAKVLDRFVLFLLSLFLNDLFEDDALDVTDEVEDEEDEDDLNGANTILGLLETLLAFTFDDKEDEEEGVFLGKYLANEDDILSFFLSFFFIYYYFDSKLKKKKNYNFLFVYMCSLFCKLQWQK